jgi:hypothetical protein
MSKSGSAENPPAKDGRSFLLLSVIAIVAIAGVSGAAVLIYSSQPSQYACISIGYHGSTLQLTTSGLIHISGSQYYISCSDGTDDGQLPTSSLGASCLTITAKEVTSTYPGAASTYYYYLTAPGHTITLQGVTTNSTEITQPNDASIQVDCS